LSAVPGSHSWRIAFEDRLTSAVFEPSQDAHAELVFVCAHGAGGHMHDPRMRSTALALRQRGIGVVRFNFPYTEKGSRRPDPMPTLMSCMKAVVDHTRATLDPRTLVIGGRSMGGRTGSMLVAEGFACDGLLLLAYPLHPAGKPDNLRDAHLSRIALPVLCINGTRDTLCQRDLMERTLRSVGPNWTMHWLEGADHSFHVLKSSGKTDAAALNEAADVSAQWMHALQTKAKPPS
jgi:predicted alpha/beta-hydrolase family hydrolase